MDKIVYKKFPNMSLLKSENWHKLAQMDRDEVVNIYNEWIEIDKENMKLKAIAREKEQEILKDIYEVLEKHKIPFRKYGRNIVKPTGYIAWFNKNIKMVISNRFPYYSQGIPNMHPKTVIKDDIKLDITCSPTTLIEGYDRLSNQYKNGQSKKYAKNKLFIESVKYATENGIDIEDYDEKSIIQIVDNHAKGKFLEDNYPDGTEVYLKHVCYECNTWVVGERRCSCGNRRVRLEVEGNLLDGYLAYPEGY